MKEINEAYAVLSDPIRRAAYDEELRRNKNPPQANKPGPAKGATAARNHSESVNVPVVRGQKVKKFFLRRPGHSSSSEVSFTKQSFLWGVIPAAILLGSIFFYKHQDPNHLSPSDNTLDELAKQWATMQEESDVYRSYSSTPLATKGAITVSALPQSESKGGTPSEGDLIERLNDEQNLGQLSEKQKKRYEALLVEISVERGKAEYQHKEYAPALNKDVIERTEKFEKLGIPLNIALRLALTESE